MAFAGIDVGTSGCKMVAYDLHGKVLAEARRDYKEFGGDGYRRIDPSIVWEEIQEAIRQVTLVCQEPIHGIAVASLGESIVCLDKEDGILYHSMVTGDKTGIKECEEIERQISKERIMDITGLPLSEMFSLPKFVWMNKNTDVFKQADKIFFYEDFVGYMLTGQRKVSYSSASRSMAFDIIKKSWSPKLLELAGVDEEKLSAPVEAGTILGIITERMSEKLGLPIGTKVVAGGWDQAMAGIGSGMIQSKLGEDGQGTCEVMLAILPRPIRNKYMRNYDLSCIPYTLPNTYLTMVEVTTCGILMNWSRDTLFVGIKEECAKNGENFFAFMDSKTDKNPTDLFVIPQFGSSGNPYIDYDAKGTIWGLTIHTTPTEIYQAIKEGLAYQMLLAYETTLPLEVEIEEISITGGGAASEYTAQLRANIFNKNVRVLSGSESGALGCAITASVSLGAHENYQKAVDEMVHIDKVYVPEKEQVKRYQEKYREYKKLFETLHNLYTKQEDMTC